MTELPTYMKQVLRFSLQAVSYFICYNTQYLVLILIIFTERIPISSALPSDVDLLKYILIHR